MVEFSVNNKVYLATMMFLFIANYGKELRIETNIRRKEKVKKTIKFTKKRKKVQKEARTVLKKV